MKDQTATRPDAKKIIDTIVEAMHKGTEPFDDAFSLVPSEFDVELHQEAYNELESIFPIIEERAAVRLDRALDQLNEAGGATVLHRWMARLKRDDAEASPPGPASNRYRPAGYGWRIRFNITLDPAADLGYIAVIAQLAAPRRDNLAGPKTRRLTVRDAEGRFKTRMLRADERVTPPDETPVSQPTSPTPAAPDAAETVRTAPPPAPAREDPSPGDRPLARLSFKDDDGPRTFTMTRHEISLGRDDADRNVDLQLRTLPDVSREHLRLRYDPDRQTFLIKDVSSYGTTIDGRPVTPSLDPTTRRDLDRWEPIPPETTIGLAGVLFIDFKSLV